MLSSPFPKFGYSSAPITAQDGRQCVSHERGVVSIFSLEDFCVLQQGE